MSQLDTESPHEQLANLTQEEGDVYNPKLEWLVDNDSPRLKDEQLNDEAQNLWRKTLQVLRECPEYQAAIANPYEAAALKALQGALDHEALSKATQALQQLRDTDKSPKRDVHFKRKGYDYTVDVEDFRGIYYDPDAPRRHIRTVKIREKTPDQRRFTEVEFRLNDETMEPSYENRSQIISQVAPLDEKGHWTDPKNNPMRLSISQQEAVTQTNQVIARLSNIST